MAKLYLVATPIGNLDDISLRALAVLKEADLVLSEKPLITKRLFAKYQINTPLRSLSERAQEKDFKAVTHLLQKGKNLAFVSEAGTPGISDPGGKLVKKILDEFNDKIDIIPIPGASALGAIISVCGFNMNRFFFIGFLPKKKKRQKFLKLIQASDVPVVVYESVYRIEKLLQELNGLAITDIILAREMTKKFETIYRGSPQMVLNQLRQDKIKGEFSLVINR